MATDTPTVGSAISNVDARGGSLGGVPQECLMSYRCEVCGKEPSYGKTVTFSHKRNNRRWLPNIQKVRVKHGSNTRRARVCTSCIRANKIQKA